MTTTVRLDEETKSRLEALQAEIRLKTGRSVSETELLKRLVDDASESRDELIDSFRASTVPLTESQKEAMQEGRFSSGVKTDDDEVDDSLYG